MDGLFHYSAEPFTLDRTRRYEQECVHHHKPRGLWLSVGDDWARWSIDEEFGLDRLRCRTRVELVEVPNVLVLSNAAELREFTACYDATRVVWPDPPLSLHGGSFIDWPRVAECSGGIIIDPYLWECRLDLDMFWYYGWDCASGCIWDLEQIATIHPADTKVTSDGEVA